MKKDKKIKETIIYILNKVGPLDENTIMELLFHIDFQYYGKYGEPFFKDITWVKTKEGPRYIKKKKWYQFWK